MSQPLTILKGDTYEAKLQAICKEPLPSDPLPDIKYKRILIPGLSGGERHFALLGFIGQALRIRGAEVTAMICDELLPLCTLQKVDHEEKACGRWCYRNSPRFAEAMNLPHRWYSEFISPQQIDQCKQNASNIPLGAILSSEYRGIALGEHITRSIESYMLVGTFDLADPKTAAVARQFFLSALYLVHISNRVLEELRIDKVLLDDGKKIDWGIIRAVAHKQGIPVDVTNTGIKGSSVRFIIDRPPSPPQLMEGWKRWQDIPLDVQQEDELDKYLLRRATVPYEWRDENWWLNIIDEKQVRQIVGLKENSTDLVFAMFPNVGFDAGKTKSQSAAYETADEWVQQTIELFLNFPQHQLIIKAHPSEHHRQARSSICQLIQNRWEDKLPPNVHIIEPDADVTARGVTLLADIVLTYTSTVTAEAAALGKPVILAGGGWHADRGVATEVRTPPQYVDLMRRILERKFRPTVNTTLARRYAYSLFFRNDIPINHFTFNDFNVASVTLSKYEDLLPGADSSMDTICRGILYDEPFENPQTINEQQYPELEQAHT